MSWVAPRPCGPGSHENVSAGFECQAGDLRRRGVVVSGEIAVVVQTAAELRRTGKDRGDAVVAVPGTLGVSVPTVVDRVAQRAAENNVI